MVARQERQAAELDQQWRARLWGGPPAYTIPPGVTPARAMLEAARDSRPKRLTPCRRRWAADRRGNSPSTRSTMCRMRSRDRRGFLSGALRQFERAGCSWDVDHGWGGNGTPLDYDELERRGSAVSGG